MRPCKKIPLVLLLCLLAAAMILPLSAAGADCRDPAHPRADTSIGGSAWLSALLGAPLSEEESAFLDTQADLVFRYPAAIPSDHLQTSVAGDVLTVTAVPYVCTGNGVTVTYLPTAAAFDGTALPLSETGGNYVGTLPLGGRDTPGTVTVSYAANVVFPASALGDLATRAYDVGHAADEALTAYETAHAAYVTRAAAYAQYLSDLAAHTAAADAYRAYLADQAAYEAQTALYADYLREMALYNTRLSEYRAYQVRYSEYEAAYAAYLTAVNNAIANEELRAAYLLYVAERDACIARLAPMEYALDPEYHLYGTLKGETVTAVLTGNQHELVTLFGCSAADIEACDAATKTLISLLDGYAALDSPEDRYRYYAENHVALVTQSDILQRCLYSLFNNAPLQVALNNKGKLIRYMQTVAQLYVFRTWLDDAVSLAPDWSIKIVIAGQKADVPLTTVFEGFSPIPDDTNTCDPTGNPFPAEVAAMGSVTLPVPPTAPLPVARPVRPEDVADPGVAPTPVEDPGTPPTAPETPGEEPVCPVTDAQALSLAAAVRDGRLTAHELPGDAALSLSATLTTGVSLTGKPTVSFYDETGRTLLGFAEADGDGRATYPGALPFKERDDDYTYTFTGFVTEAGDPADLSAVTADTAVFAAFRASERKESYTVTWQIGEETYTRSAVYRTLPVCPAPTARESASLVYTFVGWSPAVAPVTRDVTYTAVYETAPRRYTVTFSQRGADVSTAVPYGETPTPPADPPLCTDDTAYYRFTGWDAPLLPVTGDATYTALYERIPFLETGGQERAVTLTEEQITVTADDAELPLASLLSFSALTDRRLLLTRDGAALSVSPSAAARLASAGVTTLTWSTIGEGPDGRLGGAAIGFHDADGKPLATEETVTLQLAYAAIVPEDADIYSVTETGDRLPEAASYKSGWLSLPVTPGVYELIERFPVTVTVTDGTGLVAPDRSRVVAGERVTLSCLPGTGQALDSLVVLSRRDHTEIRLNEDHSFIMPRDGVTITAAFRTAIYTVRFLDGDTLIAEGRYRYGDTLTVPAMPSSRTRNGVSELFNGWSPTLRTTVTADADYTAAYRAEQSVTVDSGNDNNRFFTTTLPIAGGVLVLAGVGFFLFRRYRKKK